LQIPGRTGWHRAQERIICLAGDGMRIILCAVMMAMLLFKPDAGEQAAFDALKVWGLDVVPSLFPYMVLCQSISSYEWKGEKLLFLSFIFGLLGGSPSASASLSALVEKRPLSKRNTLLLASCAGTISPMFYSGPVASWFGSDNIAKMLLVSQYVSAFGAGAVLWLLNREDMPLTSRTPERAAEDKENPIARSVHAVLGVGGCIVFYSTAAGYLRQILPSFLNESAKYIHPLLEISGGMRTLASLPLSLPHRALLASGFCAFSSFSILSQNLLFLKPIGISMKDLLTIGCIRASFGIMMMQMLLMTVSA